MNFPLGNVQLGIKMDCWKFDSQTGWKKIRPFPVPGRVNSASFVIRSKEYVGLGQGPSGLLSDFWELDPKSRDDPGRKVADFPGNNRFSAVGFSINGRGFPGLGIGEAFFENDLWEYIPEWCD